MTTVFDRRLVKNYKNKSVRYYEDYSFLFNEIVIFSLERLKLFLTNSTGVLLNLGSRNGELFNLISKKKFQVIQCDISYNLLMQAKGCYKVVADDEVLPFHNNTFDVIISTMSLHNVNNLLEVLSKINLLLKKNGIFIGTLFGTKTLHELKESFIKAEENTGITSRILPFIDSKNAGPLLQKSGYCNPIVDIESFTIEYKNIYDIFRDLRGMGEGNVLHKRFIKPLTRKIIKSTWDIYKSSFSRDNIYVPVTFEVIILIGIKV